MLNQNLNQDRQQKITTETTNGVRGQRGLAILAMLGLLLVLLLLAYMSVGIVALPVQTGDVQPSPPAGEGSSQRQGRERELRVRAKLRGEGYEQPFGEDDQLIRQNLQLKPGQKVADFVGRNANGERYLVAESKGNDLDKAFRQLEDTANALWKKNVGATPANTEFRIYINDTQWAKLQLPTDMSRTGGYTLHDSFLANNSGIGPETLEYVLIQGKKLLVLVVN